MPCLKRSRLPAGPSVYAEEILRLRRESSLASVPTPAAAAPAAPELGSGALRAPAPAALAPSFSSSPLGPWPRSGFPAWLGAPCPGIAGALAVPWALCAQSGQRAQEWGSVARWGKRVPAEPRAPGRCWNHRTQRPLPRALRRPTNVLPVWGRVCTRVTGSSLRKGLDAGDRAAPSRECSRGLWPAPHLLLGCCTCSHPLTGKRALMGGGAVHDPGLLPWFPGRRSVGYASLFLASGEEGTRAAVMVLCLKPAPRERRGEAGAGRTDSGSWGQPGAGCRVGPPCGRRCLPEHVLLTRVRPGLAGARPRAPPTPGSPGSWGRAFPGARTRMSQWDGASAPLCLRQEPGPGKPGVRKRSGSPGRLSGEAQAGRSGVPGRFPATFLITGSLGRRGRGSQSILWDREHLPAEGAWGRAPAGAEPPRKAGGSPAPRGFPGHPGPFLPSLPAPTPSAFPALSKASSLTNLPLGGCDQPLG